MFKIISLPHRRTAMLLAVTLLLLSASAFAQDEVRRLATTDDVLRDIIPTLKVAERENNLWRDYKPELGDIIFREGHEEMFWPYKVYFNTVYTHSSIVTKLEPEVIITHCTKEKYVNGVHETPLRIWALNAQQFDVYRLKNRTPEAVEKIVASCEEMCKEGIYFDKSWDYTRSIAEPGEKRWMYCTVMIWHAYKAAGFNLVPEPYVETEPHGKMLLWMGGVRNFVLYTIPLMQQSEDLVQVANFQIEVLTIRESIRLRSNVSSDLREFKGIPDNILVDNPDPRVLVPTIKGRVIPLRVNPLYAIRHGDLPGGPPPTIQQTTRGIGTDGAFTESGMIAKEDGKTTGTLVIEKIEKQTVEKKIKGEH